MLTLGQGRRTEEQYNGCFYIIRLPVDTQLSRCPSCPPPHCSGPAPVPARRTWRRISDDFHVLVKRVCFKPFWFSEVPDPPDGVEEGGGVVRHGVVPPALHLDVYHRPGVQYSQVQYRCTELVITHLLSASSTSSHLVTPSLVIVMSSLSSSSSSDVTWNVLQKSLL